MLDWQKRHRSVCHNLSSDKSAEPRAKESQVLLPVEIVEPRVQESQIVLRTPTPREAASPQSVKRDDKRDNSVNSNDKPNRYGGTVGQHQSGPKANRNQQLKGYNNLRRPKIFTENKNIQDGDEESFESSEINVPQPVTAKPRPKPEPKPQSELEPKPRQQQLKVEPEKPKQVNQEPQPKPENQLKVTKVPTVADTTPVKKMIPKNYVVETLPIGATIILTIDSPLTERTENAFTCISLHPDYASEYDALCDQFGVDCEKEEAYMPQLGEVFAYFNPSDGGWYRARRTAPASPASPSSRACPASPSSPASPASPAAAALLDAARTCALGPRDRCARLPHGYLDLPEFSCALVASGMKIGDNLKCTIKSKSPDKCTVSIENMDTGLVLGDGEVSRWKPKIEGVESPVIPEVQRPDIKSNMKVYLVDCTSIDKVFLRPSNIEACREFDAIQEDVLLYAKDAPPITENPHRGQTVIAKFTDGLWYRALCRRTSRALDKYQLEYMEYGNIETQSKEAIYSCPPSLMSRPTPVVRAKLYYEPATSVFEATSNTTMPERALSYLQNLRDRNVELILTLADGSSSSPSGAEINLQIAKNKESVNEKVLELCTPEWKKLERQGVDIIETPRLMLTDIKYISLPAAACALDVFVDLASLSAGSVNARPAGLRLDDRLRALSERMAEYCQSELGKEPYLPAHEELCIALCPPYPQWFRAVLCSQEGGAGGARLRLCYLDYGNLDAVPVAAVRKMLPEFMEALPALALHVNIRGFPLPASNDILTKALTYMKIDDEGRGTLTVTNCREVGFGMYEADAPGLLDALN